MGKDVKGTVSSGEGMTSIKTNARRGQSRSIARNRREGRDGRSRRDDTTSESGGRSSSVTDNTETGERKAMGEE
jgi:hypothetical protein